MRIALLVAGLLVSLVAQPQEIYKWVDKDGVVHYADQPGSPDAVRVPYPALGAPEGADAAPPELYTSDQTPRMPEGPTYQSLRIVSPAPEQVFFGGGVTVPVQVELDRALRPGDRLQVFLDGQQKAETQGLGTVLSGLDRGTHSVQATVVDEAGTLVIRSAPVTFYVRQPSVLAPPAGPDVKPPPRKPRPQVTPH